MSDELRAAARAYIAARETHTGAARSALLGALDAAGDRPDMRADAEVVADDGTALTVGVPGPDGRVSHQWRMPTSVALERAERALGAAVRSASADDAELRAATLDLLAELSEPFIGYRPGFAAEEERSRARLQRHTDVFERLRAAS